MHRWGWPIAPSRSARGSMPKVPGCWCRKRRSTTGGWWCSVPGVALGQAQGEAKVTLRQLSRRCGPLSAEQESLIRSLPLQRLEALAEALLDFEGMADLAAWLAAYV